MSFRSLPWRIKTPAPRITPPNTAGGRNARHYQSRNHQQWAADVKRRDGFACQKCAACGEGVRLIADHIIEIDDGGAPLDVNNGMTLCIACHNKKSAEAFPRVASAPFRTFVRSSIMGIYATFECGATT